KCGHFCDRCPAPARLQLWHQNGGDLVLVAGIVRKWDIGQVAALIRSRGTKVLSDVCVRARDAVEAREFRVPDHRIADAIAVVVGSRRYACEPVEVVPRPGDRVSTAALQPKQVGSGWVEQGHVALSIAVIVAGRRKVTLFPQLFVPTEPV